ncbi:hypothetical protein [Sphingobacterium yanglingense]|uniref:Nitrite reductase/ring-hydroxylating ferredoxin subunit n=1 Tax=Sphingobacterium yanglingense TaxID=1437280 RepID=A0A4R6WFD3_9SPHI|nr:hypothetical protein [Sphingobacterium yanglingense]TDQ75912.1 hypothetical protein CLV99_3607 [Sphingobacterium yanglingense]
MKYIGIYIAFAFLSTLLGSCGSSGCNVIPNTTVHSSFSQGSHPKLFAAMGADYVDGGVCGLIVYNTGDGFVAFDRCSPVNPEKRNRVELYGSSIAHDPVSGAKWLLKDGSPLAIAECPLKPYRVGKFGTTYTVSN